MKKVNLLSLVLGLTILFASCTDEGDSNSSSACNISNIDETILGEWQLEELAYDTNSTVSVLPLPKRLSWRKIIRLLLMTMEL